MKHLLSLVFACFAFVGVMSITSCEDESTSPLADLDLKDYFFSESCPDSMITEVNVIRYDITTGKPSDTSKVYYVSTCNEPSPEFYVVGVHELFYNFLPKSFTTLELGEHYGRIAMKMDFYYPAGENVQNIDVPVEQDTFYYGGEGEYVINLDYTKKIEVDGDLDDMEDLNCVTKAKFIGFEDVSFNGKTYPAIVLEEKSVYETFLRGTLVEADKSTNKTYYAKGLGFFKGFGDFWKTPDIRIELVAILTPEEFEQKKQVFFANPY